MERLGTGPLQAAKKTLFSAFFALNTPILDLGPLPVLATYPIHPVFERFSR